MKYDEVKTQKQNYLVFFPKLLFHRNFPEPSPLFFVLTFLDAIYFLGQSHFPSQLTDIS
jgi:hypothetical protein